MMKVSVDKADGEILDYDITGVDPETIVKSRVFKRGHLIRTEDIEKLKNLGREYVFVKDGKDTEIHEDDAAVLIAPLVAGRNIYYDQEPTEGKVQFFAGCDGVFSVDINRLYKLNGLEIPSLPTIHTNSPVCKGKLVASFRIIPITCKVDIFNTMTGILSEPLIHCLPYSDKIVSVIVTGNEIYSGRKKDAFIPCLTKKFQGYGIRNVFSVIVPDDRKTIARAILKEAEKADIIFLTGGTSVDPDDATKLAMIDSGVELIQRGNPVQPGNNLSIGYLREKPVCCVPAAALTFQATALDIFLPRMFAGISITRDDIVKTAHGGLCHFCTTCSFPECPFGK